MSRNSGQLTLGLAIVALLGGLGFAFAKKDIAPKSTAPAVASGAAYATRKPDLSAETSLGWIRKTSAETNPWAHDLFTPVEVMWNPKTSEYAPKSELVVADSGAIALPKFGVRLLSLKHPKYRLRVSTIVEPPSKKPEDAIIFLLDDETRSSFRCKVGETLDSHGTKIKVLRYEPRQVDAKTGAVLKPVSVQIRDVSLRREIALGQTPVEFTDRMIITFAGEGSEAPLWTAAKVGDRFENEEGTFVIKGVDFEAQSVTVEKSYVADAVKSTRKTITEVLTPLPPPPPPAPPAPAPAAEGAALPLVEPQKQ